MTYHEDGHNYIPITKCGHTNTSFFLNQWFERGGSIEWRLTSPQLTPINVSFWRFVNVCIGRLSRTLENPKTQITGACAIVGRDFLQKVWQEVNTRLTTIASSMAITYVSSFLQATQVLRGSRGIALLFSGPRHWRGVGVSPTPRPPLPPGKTRYPLYRRLGGPQGRSGGAENLVPTGIRSRTVQPVVSRYNSW